MTLVEQIETKATQLANDCMGGTAKPDECLTSLFVQLEEAASDHLNRLSILAPPPTPLHCKQGCASCCKSGSVQLTPPEALFLLGIIETCGFRYAVTLAARSSAKPGCPLLDHQGLCRFYAHRPLMCRAMNSLDVAECHKCEGGEGMDVPLWLPHYETYARVQSGVSASLVKKGKAMPTLSLRKVLALETSVPLLWEEWLKGTNPFEAAMVNA